MKGGLWCAILPYLMVPWKKLEGKLSGNCAGALESFVSCLHEVVFLRHWHACS